MFAGTETVAGTVNAVLFLVNPMVIPSAGAALLSVTVQLSVATPVRELLEQVNAANVTAAPPETGVLVLDVGLMVMLPAHASSAITGKERTIAKRTATRTR